MGEEKHRQDAERMKAAATAPCSPPPSARAEGCQLGLPGGTGTAHPPPESCMVDLKEQKHSPRESAAMKAVVTLLAHSTAAWLSSTEPLEMAPRITAATAASSPTTVAWT